MILAAYKFHLCSCWFHYSISFPSNVQNSQRAWCHHRVWHFLWKPHMCECYKNVCWYYYYSQVLAQTLMWGKQNSVGWRLFVFLNSEFSQTQFLINCHSYCLRKHGGFFLLLNDIFSFYKLKESFLCPPSAAGVADPLRGAAPSLWTINPSTNWANWTRLGASPSGSIGKEQMTWNRFMPHVPWIWHRRLLY